MEEKADCEETRVLNTSNPLNLCRICRSEILNNASHLLIENNRTTLLGEKYIFCVAIEVLFSKVVTIEP